MVDDALSEFKSRGRTKPRIKLPPGYENEAAFLDEMRELISDDESADSANHEAGVEDMQFLTGDQWDSTVREQRTAARKPVLTINRIPAFVAQVIGARKQMETTIKIAPDRGGTKEVAEVREGLIRSIQKLSRASGAFDNALMGAVTAGIGNFQLVMDYESSDVWDQCMYIRPIADHFGVVWDRMLTEPSGRDATRCAVFDTMMWADFEARYPWATPADVANSRFGPETLQSSWFTKADVRVVDYWRMRERKRTLALMNDGSTRDITDDDDPAIIAEIRQRDDGTPFIRDVMQPFAQRYRCTGLDILEGPYDLPIDRIPVFRVPGWELRIGDSVYRWGLVRFLKDPQRLHNYWRSVLAEKIMKTPKATWLASSSAVSGREDAWRNSATSDDPLLIYNAEAGEKPQRVDPIQVEGALIEQIAVTAQDLKDVSNIHEANLGMPSNEVSGKAITARMQVSNTGTALYHDNLELAMEECGRVVNELIPIVYDTPRIVQVLGEDSKPLMQAINDTARDDAIDITVGKYQVSAVTGRSYATKREEAAESMLTMAQAMPQVLTVAADLIVTAMDWPDADKLAARLRRVLPPGLLTPDEMTPEEAQQAQMAAAAAQEKQGTAEQLAVGEAQSKIMKQQSDAVLNLARAQSYGAQSRAIGPKTEIAASEAESKQKDRELRAHLATIETGIGRKR